MYVPVRPWARSMNTSVSRGATAGGMKVNDKTQVLDANDESIVCLYAAGCDAGGLYGDSYDVSICEGSQQAWCVQSGKVAAEDVAENLV